MTQKININDRNAHCEKCGNLISDITQFKFIKEGDKGANFFEEHCFCKNCQESFILHYDLFDESGHIYGRVFAEDINDDSYSWQDGLTDEQKKAISDHLRICPKCVDQLSHEMLVDAWLKSFLVELRQKSTT